MYRYFTLFTLFLTPLFFASECLSQSVVVLPTMPTSADSITLRYRTNTLGARFLGDSYRLSMTNNRIRIVRGAVSQEPAIDLGIPVFVDMDIGRLPSGSYVIDMFGAGASAGQPDSAIVVDIPLVVTDNRTAKTAPYVQLNYADHWWNPAESGWGLFIWQDNLDRVLAAWFTYGSDNKAEWYTIQSGRWVNPKQYDGQLIKTTGPSFAAFVPGSAVQVQVVGTASLYFTAANNCNLTYTLNGVTQTKTITRFKP